MGQLDDKVPGSSGIVLEVTNLRHRLFDPERGQDFVVSVSHLALKAGSFVAILGPNACGKTTLLTVLGLLRRPSLLDQLQFSLHVSTPPGERTYDLVRLWQRRGGVEEIRRRHLGFALQSGELLPALTVRENIALPLHLNGWQRAEMAARVHALMEGFGLLKGGPSTQLADSRVNKLSGGEYQRVALARAIAHRPDIVFVDEPTASLNHKTARQALHQLRCLQNESGGRTAVVMITHDQVLAREFADTIVHMRAVGPTAGEMAGVEPSVPTADHTPQGTTS